ncbi:hypothetical protein DH2020_017488 [Rehmannia glutinosa]|uniref:Glycosyltransferase n=1 Tax=Rehmannia glutinosa TaxID=99300 RepID=A0ABR0WR23_REHGL
MADTGNNTLTIVMYPWFAMGHLTPYLLTANKFAERGHKIILIIPPKAQSILGPLNLHPGLIGFRPIPIPHVEGLPAHIETTNDATMQEKPLLRHALDLTQPAVQSLLSDLKPDFVFFDMLYWIPGLARRMQIKSIHYSVASPASVGFLFADGPLIEGGPTGFPASIKLYKHTARDFNKLFETKEIGSGITVKQRLMTAICESDAIGFKTCKEIEGPYCQFLESKLNKPILLAGPIVPKPQSLALDEKWADWPPLGIDKIEEALPNGFKERTRERGIVHGDWVPQQQILKHPSVGSFFTHCGYGSMWEGLMSECQLVVLPHVGDQYINARLLSWDLKVGVEVEKGDEDGLFTKEGVHRAIMAAMAEDSEIGREVRANHDKWREFLLSEGLEDAYFDNFVENLRALLE